LPRWLRPLPIAALVAVHFALGVWVLHHSPPPAIDVNIFQRDSIAALRHGRDPYGITFPDIYADLDNYGEGLSAGGRLQFGFPYPPLSLLVAAPGETTAVIGAGNPGMATGGMGDVLTGVIAGLHAQDLPPFHAAVYGALLHGAAGDAAARIDGERGLLPSDLFPHLRRLANPG
jgi:hypothetical protein